MASAPQLQRPGGDQQPGQPIRPMHPPPGGLLPGPPSPLFPPQGMPRPSIPQPGGLLAAPVRLPPPGMLPNIPQQHLPDMPMGVRHPQPLMRMPPPTGGGLMQPPRRPPLHGAGQPEVWLEHRTADGRTYYSHPQTQKTTWERPPNAQIIPQPPAGTPIGQMPGLPPPFPLPLPGMPGAPQLVPTRVWSDHKTPQGKTYYYNKVTRQSVWEKPKDFELVMPLPANFGAPSSPGPIAGGHPSLQHPMQSPLHQHHPQLSPQPMQQQQEGPSAGGGLPQASQSEPPSQADPPLTDSSVPDDVRQEMKDDVNVPAKVDVGKEEEKKMEVDQENKEEETTQAAAEIKHETPPTTIIHQPEEPIVHIYHPLRVLPPAKPEPKGPRPISSIPVPGTPWSVVWTSDERMFFFDAISRVSVWTIPEELSNHPNVEKIMEEASGSKRRVGELKSEPAAKRPKMEDDSDEEGGEMAASDLGDAPVIEMKQHLTDAVESEKKVAQIRAGKSLEERQSLFKEMLLERGVSAFSTWEKELPKFIFDPRYMLLNTKERKTCFEVFIRSRAEEERKERKTKLKEKKDDFRKLLEEAKLNPKSSFSDFALKYGKEEPFKGIEKMREREQLFSEYLTELKKATHVKEEQQKQAAKTKAEKTKSDFIAMLSETETIHERSQWRKVRTSFDRDPRYKAAESSTLREEWFKEYVKSLAEKSPIVDPEQEKQERIQASLKEREREVKMSRTAQEREWGRERDQLRKTEAVQHFKALLVDMVRNSDATWHDTKKSLRRDHRWELAELLEVSDREKLFREHVDGLTEKKRLQFRKLLEETSQITLTMPWKKVRKLIKEDPRYKNFGDSDHRREAEYDKYLRDKMMEAKNEFRALLRETKILSYKSHELIRESDKHYRDITDVLKNDQRYLVLECVGDEREGLLQEYVYELYKRGPPPPPTATNPADRLKRP